MNIRRYIYPYAAALLTGMVAVSCASESAEAPDNGLPAPVGISITAAPLGVSTRGFADEELIEDPASSSELINNWIVFFTQGNQVISYEEGGSTTGVWNDRVQTELPRGRYTVLAFANMDNAKLKNYFKDGLPEDWKNPAKWKNLINEEKNGAAIADLSRFSEFSYNSQNSDNSPLIPMSGYREINVTQTVNETFSIEVVRMLAKVQFAFKNESQTPVSIEKIEFQPVYDGDIYLFPEEGNGDNRFVEGVYPDPQNYGMRTIAPALSLPNFNDTARSTFYIKESAAKGNHPTDHFHIGISLKRGDDETENATYALASDELQTILRNDYVLFPVVISDYIPRLEVYDYPPIGGYPVQVESNGNEFYATFSSSGAFDIEAKLVNSAGETVVVSEKRSDTDTEYVECIISDQLQKELSLTYDPIEEMWHGDFKKGANPNAPIILTFKFHIGNLIYTRSLHLLSTKMNGNN